MATNTNPRELIGYARDQARGASRAGPPNSASDLPESLFAGYTLLSRFDGGGQGTVYEATENTTGKHVAIKVLHAGPFSSDAEQMRFEREIQILARLQHPHIATIHNSGTVEGRRYYVMDFIAGRTLDTYVRDEDLSIDAALALFQQICDAVHAAHLHGIVHRDLKPSNIRIDEHGQPHVLDFGLAKPVPGDSGDFYGGLEATMTGGFVGSLPWAAPEQLSAGADSIDLRTDVHGLGLLLYTMLAKSPPFTRRGNLPDVVADIREHDPPPLRSLNSKVDDELNTIVLMCLQKDPGRRYQIAGDLVEDIARYRAGDPIRAKRDSTLYLLAKTTRRHRVWAGIVFTFVLLSIGYGAVVSFLYHKATTSEQLAAQRALDAREKYQLARDALEFVVDEVSANLDGAPRAVAARQRILEGAFDRLTALAERHGDDPQLQADLMRTHYQLGDLAIQLQRYDLAEQHLLTALDLRLALQEKQTMTPEAMADLSIHHVLLGDVANQLQRLDQVEERYRLALAIDEDLAATYPDNATYQDNLAWSYDRLGALAAREGHFEDAESLYRWQFVIMERLAAAEPENAIRLHGLAAAYTRLAECAGRRKDWSGRAEQLKHAVSAGRRMLAAGADDTDLWYAHVSRLCSYRNHWLLAFPGEDDTAALLEARDLARCLVEREPELPRSQLALANSCYNLVCSGTLESDTQRVGEIAHEGLSACRQYLRLCPGTARIIEMKSVAEWKIAAVLEEQGLAEDAATHRQQALITITDALADGIDSIGIRLQHLSLLTSEPSPDHNDVISAIDAARYITLHSAQDASDSLMTMALAYRKIGDNEQALEVLEESLTAYNSQGRPMPPEGIEALQELRTMSQQ